MGGKTDNDNLASKLALREHFLDRFGGSSVLDCCAGAGVIWEYLLLHRPEIEYTAIDDHGTLGAIPADSLPLIPILGRDCDVIDIDTYGSPWEHWVSVLRDTPPRPLTVCLTFGASMLGALTVESLKAIGMHSAMARTVPIGMHKAIGMLLPTYMMALPPMLGWRVEYHAESRRGKTARYIGVRLQAANVGGGNRRAE